MICSTEKHERKMVEGQTDQDQQHTDTSLASLQSSCSALSQDVVSKCD